MDPITRKGELSDDDYRQFVAATSPEYERNARLGKMTPDERRIFFEEQLRAAETKLDATQPSSVPEPTGPVSEAERNRRALDDLKRMIEELKNRPRPRP